MLGASRSQPHSSRDLGLRSELAQDATAAAAEVEHPAPGQVQSAGRTESISSRCSRPERSYSPTGSSSPSARSAGSARSGESGRRRAGCSSAAKLADGSATSPGRMANLIHNRNGSLEQTAGSARGPDRRRGGNGAAARRRARPGTAGRRPLPKQQRHDRARGAARQGAGAARPLGRSPHRGRRAPRPLLRPGLRPRPGPALADGLLPPRGPRPDLRDGRRRGPAGRSADADSGHPPRRRGRGSGARPTAARPAGALLRGRQRRRRERPGAPVRDAAAETRVRALAAGRHPQPRQAARLRPLDQLGAGAAAGRHAARSRPRAERPPRPGLPGGQPDRHPGGLERRRAGDRRADRRGAPLDGARHRGQRLQQLGRQRCPLAPPARR